MNKIQWTDRTWNPVRGCSRVSEGCRNCYAEKIAARFSDAGKPFHGFAVTSPEGHGARWTGKVALIPGKLDEPLHWKKPARVFVNSMSDLFHEKLTDHEIARVFSVMASAPRHTFQVLTKRPKRMLNFFMAMSLVEAPVYLYRAAGRTWPLSNVWLGVSVEDQATADERIPLLLKTPAAKRFVSYEPALEPVSFRWAKWEPFKREAGGVTDEHDGLRRLDWLIYGGESGPGARPNDIEWARSARDQCKAAGVSFFCKQLGAQCMTADGGYVEAAGGSWPSGTRAHVGSSMDAPRRIQFENRKGGDPDEWPADLRVREFPR